MSYKNSWTNCRRSKKTAENNEPSSRKRFRRNYDVSLPYNRTLQTLHIATALSASSLRAAGAKRRERRVLSGKASEVVVRFGFLSEHVSDKIGVYGDATDTYQRLLMAALVFGAFALESKKQTTQKRIPGAWHHVIGDLQSFSRSGNLYTIIFINDQGKEIPLRGHGTFEVDDGGNLLVTFAEADTQLYKVISKPETWLVDWLDEKSFMRGEEGPFKKTEGSGR